MNCERSAAGASAAGDIIPKPQVGIFSWTNWGRPAFLA